MDLNIEENKKEMKEVKKASLNKLSILTIKEA